MNDPKFAKYKTAFLAVAAVILLLEVFGALDLYKIPYEGLSINLNNTVAKVYPDSPAQRAGFQEGDLMISSDGIDMKDNLAQKRRPRAKIGETRAYVVQRAGENLKLELTISGLPGKDIASSTASTIMGFCFLFFGLWAYLKAQNASTTLLALLGLCLAYAFINKPHADIASAKLRLAFTYLNRTLVSSALLWGLAFLLHFLLAFPKAKALLLKKNRLLILYGPAALISLLLVFSNFILTLLFGINTETTAWETLFGILLLLCFLGYFIAVITALAHSYVKASPHERTAHGLNIMLLGMVVGLAPLVLYYLIGLFAPQIVFPGAEFFVLALGIIPLALALAVLKKEKALTPAAA